MKTRMFCSLAAAALLLAARPAAAQQATGVYVSAGIGANYLSSESGKVRDGFGDHKTKADFNLGPAGDIYLGYDWGSFRADAELSLRTNSIDKLRVDGVTEGKNGHQRTIGIMANGYYDFEFGSRFVPYVGAGVGVALMNLQGRDALGKFSDFNTRFAYQGIAGVSYNFSPNLAANLEYRYLGTTEPTFSDNGVKVKTDSLGNHTVLLGLRYTFAPAPAPVAQVETQTQRSYLVFFDFDSSKLTPEAKQVVASAAADALQGKPTSIGVNGYTDRSGSPQYNQALSVRRAESVRRELVADGVANDLIATRGFGENDNLVPTADGVREPQNRRVEIILQ